MKMIRKVGDSQINMQMLTEMNRSDRLKIETGKRNLAFDQGRRITVTPESGMDDPAGLKNELQPDLPKQ